MTQMCNVNGVWFVWIRNGSGYQWVTSLPGSAFIVLELRLVVVPQIRWDVEFHNSIMPSSILFLLSGTQSRRWKSSCPALQLYELGGLDRKIQNVSFHRGDREWKIRTFVIVGFQTFKVFSSSRMENKRKGRLGGLTEVRGTDLLPEATIGTRLSGLKKVVLGLIN